MKKDPMHLSRRERQIMEVIYSRGESSANDVLAAMTEPPTRTAVRTFLRILEDKGHLVHRKEGREFIYRPTRPQKQVARSVLHRMLSTFFGGSIENAVVAHLSDPSNRLSPDEVQRLRDLIEQSERKKS
ncbi:MAG TPA: BlaI/MecI/CopY family transcriptional regulator [Tepidisphaeraceae bacterium]|jgi:predicted transcriptional regulator|nr:BlaI/MecI/CopY family transcriptional regulator [Tepidisphaeraceae bacterium]